MLPVEMSDLSVDYVRATPLLTVDVILFPGVVAVGECLAVVVLFIAD